jgi:hypothetical protein
MSKRRFRGTACVAQSLNLALKLARKIVFSRFSSGFVLALTLPTAYASSSFSIVPTFASNITSDPNAAMIEGAIDNVIGIYDATFVSPFATPITVNITFQEMSSGLGESEFELFAVPWNTFCNALGSVATSSNAVAAVASIGSCGSNASAPNPVTGTSSVEIKPANALALGGLGLSLPASDGTISLNTSLTFPPNSKSGSTYSLAAVTEHEIDEILGLGSTLGLGSPYDNNPAPEDLFRYAAGGARSFGLNSQFTEACTGATGAFFSINGTTDLAQFNNCNNGADYGDWQSGIGNPAKVQDGYATPGATPSLGVELIALNVIGYDAVAPEPGTFVLVGTALLGAFFLRRRAACKNLLRRLRFGGYMKKTAKTFPGSRQPLPAL